jgi:preprotein translocase subunit SecD
MARLPRWKLILCILAVVYGVLFSLPNLLPDNVLASLPPFLPHQRLNLGLDLRGGSYLLYEVDTAAIKSERLTNLVEDVRTTLTQKGIQFTELAQAGDAVNLRITDPGQIDAAVTELTSLGQPLPGSGGRDVTVSREPDQRVRLSLSDVAMKQAAIQAVAQDIEIVRRRVDEMGTKEVSITRQGTDRIVIEAPGESDPEKLKSIVGRTAKLTFQMVDETVSGEDMQAGRAPPGSEILQEQAGGQEPQLAVKRRALVTGEMLLVANPDTDPQTGQPDIHFRFNSQGARRFADATTQNVGKRFAIVLDNKIISAPVIINPILGGDGVITGRFTPEEANNLALLLRSGALPAPLKVLEQSTVGAELGADAIRAGAVSLIIGIIAIFIFIVLAYGLFGLFAAAALIVNGLLVVGTLSFIQATLTLPGIAGVVLTLAVAIDANVLIYERMRDEKRAGHSLMMSIDKGYELAYPSIFDANLTTLISAVIMFNLGSGPVKGFAWTLMVGVVTSVFTAILITQVLIGLWLRSARPKQLPI